MKPVVDGKLWRGLLFAAPISAAMWGLIILGVLALTGCAAFSPATEVEVSYNDGAGKMITARYSSTKDVEAPAFELVRDAAGNVQRIVLSAAGSNASAVQAENRAIIGSVVEGAVRGALEGVRRAVPVPGASFSPAETEMIRAMRIAGMAL